MVAVMVPVSASAAVMFWMMALSVAGLLLVIYTGEVRKRDVLRRLVVGVVLAAALTVAIVASEPGIIVSNPCNALEPYSWEWYAAGCWMM